MERYFNRYDERCALLPPAFSGIFPKKKAVVRRSMAAEKLLHDDPRTHFFTAFSRDEFLLLHFSEMVISS